MKLRTLVLGTAMGLGAWFGLFLVSILDAVIPGFRFYFALFTMFFGLILALVVLVEVQNA